MTETFTISEKEVELMKVYGLEAEKLKNCSFRSYSFGECVIAEGMENGMIFLVTEGKAKVGVTTPNGKNLILCFYLSGGLMGEVELFTDEAAGSSTVTALDNFKCVAIPTECNKNYLKNNLAFAHIAASELSKKLMKSTNSVVESTLYTAEKRLCRYILAASDGKYFRDIMTDVAYSVGISYRHLYRMMGVLCRDGILEKTNAGYRICDIEGLEKRC